MTVSYTDHFLNENAPTDLLNPSSATSASVTVSQDLAQGFGIALNERNITVARINLNMSDLAFRTEVTNVATAVLDAYYALAADYDDLKAKDEALSTARRFLDETRSRLEAGTLAALDVVAAENQLAIAMQAQVASRTALEQQQIQLRSLISRTGSGDPAIAHAPIVPVDRLEPPDTEALPNVDELIAQATSGRSDLLQEKGSLQASVISALGTRNGLLPTLQATVGSSDAGLAGQPQVYKGKTTDPYLIGGIGSALAQVFRRNFPTNNASVTARATLFNGRAQADFGVDQLQLRQQELVNARDANQAQVDVVNAVVGLQQARSRYDAAHLATVLQEQLLDAEQKKFDAGASTSYNVVQQQRDLTAAPLFRGLRSRWLPPRPHQPRCGNRQNARRQPHLASGSQNRQSGAGVLAIGRRRDCFQVLPKKITCCVPRLRAFALSITGTISESPKEVLPVLCLLTATYLMRR